jgi:hypothetical protein
MRVRGDKSVVGFECVATETDESNEFHAAGAYELTNCFDRDTGGPFRWKSVDACADGWESDGADVVLPGKFETTPVAVGEEIVFAAIAPVPDGTDCVEDPLGGKFEAGGSFRVSGRTAVKFAAGGEEVRASGTMDGAVNTTTAKQRSVGCIHDGVDLLVRDVSLNCGEIGHVRISGLTIHHVERMGSREDSPAFIPEVPE